MNNLIIGFVSCFLFVTIFGWIPSLIVTVVLIILYVFLMKYEKHT